MVAYLASEAAEDVTGCTLYAGGDRVGILADPSMAAVGVEPGGWSLDSLAEHFEDDVAADVERRGRIPTSERRRLAVRSIVAAAPRNRPDRRASLSRSPTWIRPCDSSATTTTARLLTDNGSGVIALNDRLGIDADDPLAEYINGEYDASEYADADADHDVADVDIGSPVGRPGKVIAAPLNYENHIEEALSDRDITTEEWFSIKDKGTSSRPPPASSVRTTASNFRSLTAEPTTK